MRRPFEKLNHPALETFAPRGCLNGCPQLRDCSPPLACEAWSSRICSRRARKSRSGDMLIRRQPCCGQSLSNHARPPDPHCLYRALRLRDEDDDLRDRHSGSSGSHGGRSRLQARMRRALEGPCDVVASIRTQTGPRVEQLLELRPSCHAGGVADMASMMSLRCTLRTKWSICGLAWSTRARRRSLLPRQQQHSSCASSAHSSSLIAAWQRWSGVSRWVSRSHLQCRVRQACWACGYRVIIELRSNSHQLRWADWSCMADERSAAPAQRDSVTQSASASSCDSTHVLRLSASELLFNNVRPGGCTTPGVWR